MRVVQLTGRHLCQAFLGAPEQAGGRGALPTAHYLSSFTTKTWGLAVPLLTTPSEVTGPSDSTRSQVVLQSRVPQSWTKKVKAKRLSTS